MVFVGGLRAYLCAVLYFVLSQTMVRGGSCWVWVLRGEGVRGDLTDLQPVSAIEAFYFPAAPNAGRHWETAPVSGNLCLCGGGG